MYGCSESGWGTGSTGGGGNRGVRGRGLWATRANIGSEAVSTPCGQRGRGLVGQGLRGTCEEWGSFSVEQSRGDRVRSVLERSGNSHLSRTVSPHLEPQARRVLEFRNFQTTEGRLCTRYVLTRYHRGHGQEPLTKPLPTSSVKHEFTCSEGPQRLQIPSSQMCYKDLDFEFQIRNCGSVSLPL